MSVRALVSAVGEVVSSSARVAFIRPVQAGRVQIRVWPTQMRVTIIATYVVYGAVVLSVVLAPLIVARGPGYNDAGLAPWGAVPVTVGLWASMVLLFLASLTLHPLWRVGSWVLLAIPHLLTAGTVALIVPTPGVGRPLLSLLVAGTSWLLGTVLLVTIVAIGSGRPLRTGVVVLAVVALTLTYLVPQLVAMQAPMVGSVGPAITAIIMTFLAMPLAVAAGTAFVQITINLTTATMVSVRAHAPTWLWLVVGPVAALATLVVAVTVPRDADSGGVPITIGFTVLSAVTSMVALVVAHRRAKRMHVEHGAAMSYPRPLVLSEILADVSMVLGILLGSWGIPLLLGFVMPLPALLRERPAQISDLLMAAAALVLTVRAARAGRTAAAMLLPPVALMGLYSSLRGWLELPTLSGSVSSATLTVGLAGVAILWARRGGGRHRWFVLSLGAVILLVFPFREAIAEPLEAVLGPSQVGVLLVGLVWLLLTEAEFTHRGSPRFGRTARILVFLAYALFTAAMMAAVAYGADGSVIRVAHLGELADIGDAIIGYAVAPAVIVGLVALGHRDIDPVSRSPEPAGHRKVRS